MECYQAGICAHLWVDPQINFDGRVLGCTVNYWGDFGNAFQEGLGPVLNNERMNRAREMLLGRATPSDDIPCTSCTFYRRMKTTNRWLTETELRVAPEKRRWQIGLENVLSGRSWTWRGYRAASRVRQILREGDASDGGLPGLARRVGKETRRVFGSRPPRPWRGGVHPLWEPMQARWGEGWDAANLAHGRSRGIPSFGCHVSELAPGTSPHPPHRHPEEEILLVLSGEVEVILPDIPAGAETFRRRLRPGEFAYYPTYFGHTVQTVSRGPSRYLMFKWRGRHGGNGETLGHGVYEPLAALGDVGQGGGGLRTLKVMEGPTEWLARLQCHSSALPPGSAYPPHVDPYDVAIVLLKGEVETLGRRVEAGSLVLHPSGQPHGMRNAGEVPAEYIVFEFQGRPSFLEKARDPRRWTQKIRSLR
jgi:quercetin dioxygenase-like cupin family protein